MLVDFPKSGLLEESIAIIRNKETKPSRFRAHLRKIGRYLVYEASQKFDLIKHDIETPIATATVNKMKHQTVIISVLRAALPMVDAIFEEFDDAALGVASASRGKMLDEEGKEFKIQSDYMKIPPLEGKIALLVDPMLATASTILYLLEEVSKHNPVKIVIIAAIASEYGINQVVEQYPNVDIYCAAVDQVLNDHGYIVPGLGDAGDRACNTPHQ